MQWRHFSKEKIWCKEKNGRILKYSRWIIKFSCIPPPRFSHFNRRNMGGGGWKSLRNFSEHSFHLFQVRLPRKFRFQDFSIWIFTQGDLHSRLLHISCWNSRSSSPKYYVCRFNFIIEGLSSELGFYYIWQVWKYPRDSNFLFRLCKLVHSLLNSCEIHHEIVTRYKFKKLYWCISIIKKKRKFKYRVV